MESEISVLQVEKRIRTRVKRQMEKTQREYYLNEQMKAIQKELGDEEGKDELGELEQKIKQTKLSKEARDKAQAEMKKLRQMSPDVGRSDRRAQLSGLDALLALGRQVARSRKTSRMRRRSSTPTISASTRSRSASSNISPCSSAPTS